MRICSGMKAPAATPTAAAAFITFLASVNMVAGEEATIAKGAISLSRFKEAVTYLASDAMDGRAVGTAGSRASMEYIREKFEEAGLQPGTRGSFIQPYAHNYKGTTDGANVVGVLPGTDPLLKAEAVVVVAHRDHLGRTRAEGCPNDTLGKSVMPGANDNASGTAALFELAHALAALKDELKRTVVFVALDAEECGCTGANHYVFRDPAHPIEKTIYALNIDSIGQGGELTDYETDTESGYGETCDVDAEVFARRGVPSASLEADNPDWHKPSDTVERINFPEAIKAVEKALDIVWGKAQAPGQSKRHG